MFLGIGIVIRFLLYIMTSFITLLTRTHCIVCLVLYTVSGRVKVRACKILYN